MLIYMIIEQMREDRRLTVLEVTMKRNSFQMTKTIYWTSTNERLKIVLEHSMKCNSYQMRL